MDQASSRSSSQGVEAVADLITEVLPSEATLHRQAQFKYIYNALNSTPAPGPEDGEVRLDFVPTSITMAGPGNYGKKEIEDGNEVVMLNDDVLTSVANATVVIVDGNDLERTAVLYQFPQFLEHCPDECINVMVPRICSEAVSWTPEAQMAAGEALFFVVNMKAPRQVAKQIAWAALTIASGTTNHEIFDACGEIVSMILPQVHRYDVLQFVVPDAVERAVSSKAHDRRLAASIIGSLNDTLTAHELEGIFRKTVLHLSADADDSIRAMIAQSMAAVTIKLPIKTAEKDLWPRLKQLMKDPNGQVRASAMRAMAKSAEAHRKHANEVSSYGTMLLPLFLEHCKRAEKIAASDLRTVSDDTYLTLEIFAEVYGYFLCSVAPLMGEDIMWDIVLSTFRKMTACNGPTVRHWCAFNMPSISTVLCNDRSEKLSGIVVSLAGDSDLETRATLAAGIHELAKHFHGTPLRNDVIRAIGMLFMDENAQVRMKALGHFAKLLKLLSPGQKVNLERVRAQIRASEAGEKKKNGEVKQMSAADEDMRRLAPMFSSLEMMSFDSWRTQKLLAEELQESAHLIPQEMLCEHVAPLLFQMARESTFLVRKASMKSLVRVLRYIPDVRRRNHILKHFKTEWAHGKVYWTRLAYIDAAESAYTTFSKRLFTQLFKEDLLSMHTDVVPNVRLRLLSFLEVLAPFWKTLPRFVEVLKELNTDKDPQVQSEANDLLTKLSSFENINEKEKEKDKVLENEENAFYVHRSNKKRKKQPAAALRQPKDGRNESKIIDGVSREEAMEANAQANVKKDKQSGLNDMEGMNNFEEIEVVASGNVGDTKDQDKGGIQKEKNMVRERNKGGDGNICPTESDKKEQVGFFKKLFASCFGMG